MRPPAPDPRGPRPLVVGRPEPRRSRAVVFFRLPLAVPHLLWLWGWTTIVTLLVPVAWLVALVLGRLPLPLHRFLRAYARYTTQLTAFVTLACNPFPGFVGMTAYPLDLEVPPPQRMPRLGILLRWVIVVPAAVVVYVLHLLLWIVVPPAWVIALLLGRLPAGLQDVLCYVVRWQALTLAYGLLLTRRYPTFADPS